MKCVNCDKSNPERWLFCRYCCKKTSDPKFTTNLFMMSEMGKRTDIELRTTTIEEDIKDINKKRGYA